MITTAAILAAGVGSRLDPLTRDRPKCLVKVGGRPILQHQLDALRAAGIERVIIVVGYQEAAVRTWCRTYRGLSIDCVTNVDYEFTNNMYSALLLRSHLDGIPFLLCNGDVVYDEKIVLRMAEDDQHDAVGFDPDFYDEESMKITTDFAGFVRRISKDIDELSAAGSAIDLYRFSADGSRVFFAAAASLIEDQQIRDQWTEVALSQSFASGAIQATAEAVNGLRWVEIDTVDDLSRADHLFSDFDITDYHQVFVDLDGTLVLGHQPIPGAARFLQSVRDRGQALMVLTNNSSDSKAGHAARLTSRGIHVTPDEIILSTDGLIAFLDDRAIQRVYCLGTDAMVQTLAEAGIEHSETDGEVVVVGFDTGLTYDKLCTAVTMINAGVPYYATHRDTTFPSEEGPLPDIGTIIATLETTTGVAPTFIFGKPTAAMLAAVRREPGTRAVMIGDRLETDQALAIGSGLDFVCVLTGDTKRRDLEVFREEAWPTIVVPSVASLIHPTARRAGYESSTVASLSGAV